MLPLLIRKVHGHSMMPSFPPNTYICGLRWFNTLKTGNVIVFEHQGKEKIKRIEKIVDQKLYVVGDHKDASTDSRAFGLIETDSVTAKVIWPRSNKL
ncbi:hypothetical protein KDA00_03715 [Candidatus Saccharibacteria bacterium]|nr:hypothetical protein [Candidatus Saccharibacteria bacterium]